MTLLDPCVGSVDDLEVIGDLDRYIALSQVVLVFATAPYMRSKNCMFELRSAVGRSTPLVLLVDYSAEEFGPTEIERELEAADGRYAAWGFDDDGLQGRELFAALRANPPIEWSRLSAFQDVAMRLIAEQLLTATRPQSLVKLLRTPKQAEQRASCHESSESKRAGRLSGYSPGRLSGYSPRTPDTPKQGESARGTFLDGAAELERPPLPAPRMGRAYHIYCSPHVQGGLALTEELRSFYGGGRPCELCVTEQASEMALCDYMLVYLTRETWQRPTESAAFAREVADALRSGVQLLLAHEMPGLGQLAERGVEFAHFFEADQTPMPLIRAGIYKQVAVSASQRFISFPC